MPRDGNRRPSRRTTHEGGERVGRVRVLTPETMAVTARAGERFDGVGTGDEGRAVPVTEAKTKPSIPDDGERPGKRDSTRR